MNDILTDKTYRLALAKVPFLSNYPFAEFDISCIETVFQSGTTVIGTPNFQTGEVIEFGCVDVICATVRLMENIIWKVYELRESFSNLNEFSRDLTMALSDSSIVVKKAGINNAIKQFARSPKIKTLILSSGLFSEILDSFLINISSKKRNSIEFALSRLEKGVGILFLSEEEERTILNYYQFQLIYFKIILGIIIAAKIAM